MQSMTSNIYYYRTILQIKVRFVCHVLCLATDISLFLLLQQCCTACNHAGIQKQFQESLLVGEEKHFYKKLAMAPDCLGTN
jgi:hypothetical protein